MNRRRWLRRVAGIAGVAAAAYGLLAIPAPEPAVDLRAATTPFAWRQDARWDALEAQFQALRGHPCEVLAAETAATAAQVDRILKRLEGGPLDPEDATFDSLEELFFTLATRVAACPRDLPGLLARASRLRTLVKRQSVAWPIEAAARRRLYRLLYGSRAAVEEVMLQVPEDDVPTLLPGTDEKSATPSANLLGVTVHSGDLLVSRGGAPTSALIARGSDFPGNFSHVALLHVTDDGEPTVIEAHIEKGVVPAAIPQYLEDTKLRVMVLRLRADLAQVEAEPMLPHRAAERALAEARRRHIPYDFAMNGDEHTRLFCSEVASAAYEPEVSLWSFRSTISSPGVRRWLAAFGVRNFATREPSDLEYDPQVIVVAEWRDPQTLWQDHLDNAVVEAMLERAEAGEPLDYSATALPLVRLAKAWSSLLNVFGGVGPVPEGMPAAAALRNTRFSARHTAIRSRLQAAADAFQTRKGYRPPYWELVRMARTATSDTLDGGE